MPQAAHNAARHYCNSGGRQLAPNAVQIHKPLLPLQTIIAIRAAKLDTSNTGLHVVAEPL